LRLILAACAVFAASCFSGHGASPTARPEPEGTNDEPGAVLEAFSAALEGGRFEAAYALLSARWRARETPARLAEDYRSSGSVGPDALHRVRALLAAGERPRRTGSDQAVLVIGAEDAARLVREGKVWRVDALE